MGTDRKKERSDVAQVCGELVAVLVVCAVVVVAAGVAWRLARWVWGF